MANWYTVDTPEAQERLGGAWADAPLSNLEVCEMILDIARGQVVEFAPDPADEDDAPEVLPDPAVVPTRYVYAQLQHAKTLWNAGRVNSQGDVGMGEFVFTPRPLDKTIRQIIRPTKGRFSVG